MSIRVLLRLAVVILAFHACRPTAISAFEASSLDRAATYGCTGMGVLFTPILWPFTLGKYRPLEWGREVSPTYCRAMLAEAGMTVAGVVVDRTGHPNSSAVFGAGEFDRFFRTAFRTDSTTNFLDGGVGAIAAPITISVLSLAVAGGTGGFPSYQRMATRGIPMLWLGVGGTLLPTAASKHLFGRERPYERFDNTAVLEEVCDGQSDTSCRDEGRSSFFSGHASIAFFAASFMDRVLSDAVRTSDPDHTGYALVGEGSVGLRALRALQAATFYGLATGVAYSRIQIDRHYMTDVLVGALVGGIHGQLLYRWGYDKEEESVSVSAFPGGRGLAFNWNF